MRNMRALHFLTKQLPTISSTYVSTSTLCSIAAVADAGSLFTCRVCEVGRVLRALQLSAIDGRKKTPIMLALARGHNEIATILRAHGAVG